MVPFERGLVQTQLWLDSIKDVLIWTLTQYLKFQASNHVEYACDSQDVKTRVSTQHAALFHLLSLSLGSL